jgi:cytochrome P450
MAEGTLILALLVRAFRFDLVPDRVPVPQAHLTLRARDGIHLRLTPRSPTPSKPPETTQ